MSNTWPNYECCGMTFPSYYWPYSSHYDSFWCPKCGNWLELATCVYHPLDNCAAPSNAFEADKKAQDGVRHLDESILKEAVQSSNRIKKPN